MIELDPTLAALMGIVLLCLLMFLRMPIAFAMFIVGFIGLIILANSNAAFNLLSSEVWGQFSNYSLSVIPMYILMGEIVFRAGITEKMFQAAYKWVGHLKGGMAGTTILASAGFGSICGSNSATAASMGTMALPELKKYKYNEALSTGSVAAGGTLGVIIPPSTVLIVLAIQTEQSITDLFVASLIPSILLTFLMLMTVTYLCKKYEDYGPAGPKSRMKEKLISIIDVIPILLLLIFVIGGLFLGWFTSTESGAVGAFGAMIIALAMKKLTWGNFKAAILSTIKSSTMVMTLIVGATIFGRFLTITRLPYNVSDWVHSLPVPPTIILITILLIYVIGGSLMDAMGFLIISIPIFFPTVIGLGYDPVWFAIILCIVTSMGAITPPVGVNVFVVKGLSPGTSISTIFRGSSYFLVAYVIFLAVLIIFPQLVLMAV